MTKNGNYIVTKTETHAGKSPKGQCRTIWRSLCEPSTVAVPYCTMRIIIHHADLRMEDSKTFFQRRTLNRKEGPDPLFLLQ